MSSYCNIYETNCCCCNKINQAACISSRRDERKTRRILTTSNDNKRRISNYKDKHPCVRVFRAIFNLPFEIIIEWIKTTYQIRNNKFV